MMSSLATCKGLAHEALLVGVRIRAEIESTCSGMVAETLPRRSALANPPVANIDQARTTFQ